MHIRKSALAVIAMTAVLSSCGLVPSDHDYFQQKCAEIGINQGSPNYDTCMLQQQRLLQESTESSMLARKL